MPHIPRNIQGPFVEADFWAQWGSTNPRMALFIKVTPKAEFGGAASAKGFTSNTRDMTLPGHAGITFKSSPGITPSTIEMALDEPTNLEMTGIYTSDSFVQSEVIAGKWNFAEIELFSASWDAPAKGELVHMRGNLGEFKDYQRYFIAEGRGLLSRLSNDVDKKTARFCRVKKFRDAECGHTAPTVVIATVTYNIVHTLTVASVTDNYNIVFTKLAGTANDVPDDFFANGEITALGATANGSLKREMRASDTQAGTILVKFRRRFPFTISVGQQFELIAGCSHMLDDCIKFDNIVNRRAEDWIPGLENAFRVPSGT